MQHPSPHASYRRATPPPFTIKRYLPEAQPMGRCTACDELTEVSELANSQVGNCWTCEIGAAK